MTTSTTQSPIKDIQKAESDAKTEIEGAKQNALEDIEKHKSSEDTRLENKKAELKDKSRTELKAEKNSLGSLLKSGGERTEKAKKALVEKCEKNHHSIVKKLVDKFLSLES